MRNRRAVGVIIGVFVSGLGCSAREAERTDPGGRKADGWEADASVDASTGGEGDDAGELIGRAACATYRPYVDALGYCRAAADEELIAAFCCADYDVCGDAEAHDGACRLAGGDAAPRACCESLCPGYPLLDPYGFCIDEDGAILHGACCNDFLAGEPEHGELVDDECEAFRLHAATVCELADASAVEWESCLATASVGREAVRRCCADDSALPWCAALE